MIIHKKCTKTYKKFRTKGDQVITIIWIHTEGGLLPSQKQRVSDHQYIIFLIFFTAIENIQHTSCDYNYSLNKFAFECQFLEHFITKVNI